MTPFSITLENILAARERRADVIDALRAEHGLPVVCLTMNIAGEIKRTPLVRLLFNEGLRLIEGLPFDMIFCKMVDEPTGCEAFFVFNAPAEGLKRAAEQIEESFCAARLFDIDVTSADGERMTRAVQRRCLICQNAAAACARSRAHGLEAVAEKTNELLLAFTAELVDESASDAIMGELYATPKPGLVDRRNNGAHRDMDFALFEKSAKALKGYFKEAFLCGYGRSVGRLKALGLQAEQRMRAATDNVNTHMGAIYTLGLLAAGVGAAMLGGEPYRSASLFARAIYKTDSRAAVGRSVHGARAEAFLEFPDVKNAVAWLDRYKERDDRAALALSHLMETVDDTNILRRGGGKGLSYMHAEAKRVNLLPENERTAALYALDDDMIRKNLSPGGCADLLAAALFMSDMLARGRGVFK